MKHPKRWRRNRRLNKKFLKNPQKYLPKWVWEAWQDLPMNEKAMREIMAEEDRLTFEELKKK